MILERMITMASDDYIDWAAEYKREIETTEYLIAKKEQLCKTRLRSTERELLEKSLSFLYEQRIQCLAVAKILEDRARIIREREAA